MRVYTLKKALYLSAFFSACFPVLVQPGNAASDVCNSKEFSNSDFSRSGIISRVVDGDTIHLKDKTKIRIIGINTPELAHYPKQAEPLAAESTKFVEKLLPLNTKIYLINGKQRQDRYGRKLAHVFLKNGENLAAMLLEKGLASAIVVPPNDRFNQCYFAIEKRIRKRLNAKNKSVWSHPYFKYMDANKINKSNTGFKFIKGKIQRLGKSRDSIWLQLAPKFAIRIKRKDFQFFKDVNLNRLNFEQVKNKTIYVRGWITIWKKEFYLQLRHPYMADGFIKDS